MKKFNIILLLIASLAFIFPLSISYFSTLFAVSLFLTIASSGICKEKKLLAYLSLAMGMLGFLDLFFALCFSVLVLLTEKRYSALVLLLGLSNVLTLDGFLSEFLFKHDLELFSSLLIFALAVAFIFYEKIFTLSLAFSTVCFLTIILKTIGLSNDLLLVISGLCFTSLVILITSNSPINNGINDRVCLASLIIILLSILFDFTFLRAELFGNQYYLFKNEGEFTRSLNETFKLSNSPVIPLKISNIDKIQDGSTLFVADLSLGHYEDLEIIKIKEVAEAKKLNVILFAEHTNVFNNADNINKLIGERVVNNDLLVPYGNTDTNGVLRGSSTIAWDPNTYLNRGASLSVTTLNQKVLLAGDSWHAEKISHDTDWIGDFREQSWDRSGRLPLAICVKGDATWTVFGDSSFALNKFILENPNSLAQANWLSSGWGSLLRDTIILLLFLSIFYTSNNGIRSGFVLLLLTVVFSISSELDRPAFISPMETPFSKENFSEQILLNPDLVARNFLFIKEQDNIKNLDSYKSNTVVFGLIDEVHTSIGVEVSNCRRIGGLNINNELQLNDAQSCSINGADSILIGDKNGAAAFIKRNTDGYVIVVILDRMFLAKDSLTNSRWLQQKMEKL